MISVHHLCYYDSSVLTSGSTLVRGKIHFAYITNVQQLKIPLETIETVNKSNSFYGMLPTELEVVLKDGKKVPFLLVKGY